MQWAAVATVTAILLLSPSPGSAHTGVESSDPGAGSVIESPVDQITLVFTDQAEPVGDGFQLVDPSGVIRSPDSWETADGRTYVLRFNPPITGGLAGMLWTIRAADSHTLNGSFTFTVDVEPVDVTIEPPPETDPDGSSATAESAASTSVEETAVDAAVDSAVDTAENPPADQAVEPAIESAIVALPTDGPRSISEQGLDGSAGQRLLGLVGRALAMTGTLTAIGALIVLLRLLRGTAGEGRFVVTVARRAVLAVAVGAVLAAVSQVAIQGGTWSATLSPVGWVDALTSRFGAGVALQLIAVFGITTGSYFRREPLGRENSEIIKANLAGVGVLAAGPRAEAATNHPPLDDADQVGAFLTPMLFRWQATSASSGAILGIVALLSAALVDGHTLGGGSVVLVTIATLAHVLAGAVWLGGVVVLAYLIRRRFRSHRRVEAIDLAVRYSVLATLALVTVAVAGLLLTNSRIESLSQLWTTPWGQLVLAKLGLVGVVTVMGAINHFILLPRVATRSEDIGLGTLLKRMVTAEVLVLVAVVAISAQLVASSL